MLNFQWCIGFIFLICVLEEKYVETSRYLEGISLLPSISLSDDVVYELYQKYREALHDEDNSSYRRLNKNDKEYEVHIEKLKQVNGYKKHNLKLQAKHGSEPVIYINNPVESKLPRPYLSLGEFKDYLVSRSVQQRSQIMESRKFTKYPPIRIGKKNKPTRTQPSIRSPKIDLAPVTIIKAIHPHAVRLKKHERRNPFKSTRAGKVYLITKNMHNHAQLFYKKTQKDDKSDKLKSKVIKIEKIKMPQGESTTVSSGTGISLQSKSFVTYTETKLLNQNKMTIKDYKNNGIASKPSDGTKPLSGVKNDDLTRKLAKNETRQVELEALASKMEFRTDVTETILDKNSDHSSESTMQTEKEEEMVVTETTPELVITETTPETTPARTKKPRTKRRTLGKPAVWMG